MRTHCLRLLCPDLSHVSDLAFTVEMPPSTLCYAGMRVSRWCSIPHRWLPSSPFIACAADNPQYDVPLGRVDVPLEGLMAEEDDERGGRLASTVLAAARAHRSAA